MIAFTVESKKKKTKHQPAGFIKKINKLQDKKKKKRN